MKLNHLNLTVSNVQETHHFLEEYLGLKGFGAMAPGEAMSFLSDDNGMVLALFRGKNGAKRVIRPAFTLALFRRARSTSIRSISAFRKTALRFRSQPDSTAHGPSTFSPRAGSQSKFCAES